MLLDVVDKSRRVAERLVGSCSFCLGGWPVSSTWYQVGTVRFCNDCRRWILVAGGELVARDWSALNSLSDYTASNPCPLTLLCRQAPSNSNLASGTDMARI